MQTRSQQEQELEGLRQQLLAMQAERDELRASNSRLEAQAQSGQRDGDSSDRAPRPGPSAQASAAPRLKRREPDPYKGGSAAAFNSFEFAIEEYLEGTTLQEWEQVNIVGACLQGNAAVLYRELKREARASDPPRELAVRDVMATLRAEFAGVNLADEARSKLRCLMQGSRSVADHAAAMRKLLATPGLDKPSVADQLYTFRTGLRPDIQEKLLGRTFATLSELIAAAAEIEQLQRQLHTESVRLNRMQAQPQKGEKRTRKRGDSKDGKRTPQRAKPTGRVTAGTDGETKDKIVCHGCGDAGHYANKCPAKATQKEN